MTLLTKVYLTILGSLLFLVISAGLYSWYADPPAPISTVQYVKPPEIREVVKIQRVTVPGPEKVITVEKKVLVEKIKLPDWFLDETEQAIATAVIPPYEGKTNIIATLNTETGAGNIIARQEKLSLFAFENNKEAGVRAGISSDKFSKTATVFGRWQFLRVGNTHLGLYGEANSDGEGVAQIEFTYRF